MAVNAANTAEKSAQVNQLEARAMFAMLEVRDVVAFLQALSGPLRSKE
jgi:hypothetical protein